MTYAVFAATRRAAISILIATALVSQLPQPGFAANSIDTWKVDLAQSHFSRDSNTVILKQESGKAMTQRSDVEGTSRASTFFVIANGRVYLATDEAAYDASGKVTKTIDYNRWREMKPVQIGFYVRSTRCGFYLGCRTGQSDRRMVFTFNTRGVDVREQMSNAAVLTAR